MSDAPMIREGDEVLIRGVVAYANSLDGTISVDLTGGGRAYIKACDAEKIIHRHKAGDLVCIPAEPAGMAPGRVIAVAGENEWAVVDLGGGAPAVVEASSVERAKIVEGTPC